MPYSLFAIPLLNLLPKMVRLPRSIWGLFLVGVGFLALTFFQNDSYLAATETVVSTPHPALTEPARLPVIPVVEEPSLPTQTPAAVHAYITDPVLTLGIRATGETYGTSVRGRLLWVYTFGEGEEIVAIIGAIHGNEKSTALLARDLINHFIDHPTDIPPSTKVLVVPVANPDGYIIGQRTNARQVDLNRNFATTDWQSLAQASGGRSVSGGFSAFSEPESDALRALLDKYRPARLIALHARGEVVNPEPDEGSRMLARTIVDLAGYRYEEDWVYYPTTGTMTLWAKETLSSASVTWELASYFNPDWERNKDALLAATRGTGLIQGAEVIRFAPVEELRFTPIIPES